MDRGTHINAIFVLPQTRAWAEQESLQQTGHQVLCLCCRTQTDCATKRKRKRCIYIFTTVPTIAQHPHILQDKLFKTLCFFKESAWYVSFDFLVTTDICVHLETCFKITTQMNARWQRQKANEWRVYFLEALWYHHSAVLNVTPAISFLHGKSRYKNVFRMRCYVDRENFF